MNRTLIEIWKCNSLVSGLATGFVWWMHVEPRVWSAAARHRSPTHLILPYLDDDSYQFSFMYFGQYHPPSKRITGSRRASDGRKLSTYDGDSAFSQQPIFRPPCRVVPKSSRGLSVSTLESILVDAKDTSRRDVLSIDKENNFKVSVARNKPNRVFYTAGTQAWNQFTHDVCLGGGILSNFVGAGASNKAQLCGISWELGIQASEKPTAWSFSFETQSSHESANLDSVVDLWMWVSGKVNFIWGLAEVKFGLNRCCTKFALRMPAEFGTTPMDRLSGHHVQTATAARPPTANLSLLPPLQYFLKLPEQIQVVPVFAQRALNRDPGGSKPSALCKGLWPEPISEP
ncbi:hypothetical protein FB45DRAFT_1094371 [Roridomyces roridus]|uniref:Uncharacterized protein n=1 Tax=Roridomyces roridus TaxID=1738132 RepID=A0AAD7FI98_9AGAR|nr:hypothetical protein FB45DRAFT_1094371 [Roridomyces roridus]